MTLERMIFGMQLRFLAIVLGVLWVLIMIGELFESARYLFSGKGSFEDVILYFLCRTMVLARFLLPIAWVVATCLVFAGLGRSLELRALAAAGVGPLRMAFVVLSFGLGVVVITIGVEEFLVPRALDHIESLMQSKFGRFDSTWRFFSHHHWFQGVGNRFFYIGHRVQDGRELKDVVLFEMDSDFSVKRRIDIKRVVRKDDKWIGHGVASREFAKGQVGSFRKIDKYEFDWPEDVEHFRDLTGRPAQKPFSQLVSHIEEMEKRGLSSVEYRLELHNRFAFPFLGWLLVLFVLPWITMPHRKSSLAGALIQAAVLVFCAYFLVGLATAIVSAGVMDVYWGAWLPVVVIAVISAPKWIYVLYHRRMIEI